MREKRKDKITQAKKEEITKSVMCKGDKQKHENMKQRHEKICHFNLLCLFFCVAVFFSSCGVFFPLFRLLACHYFETKIRNNDKKTPLKMKINSKYKDETMLAKNIQD